MESFRPKVAGPSALRDPGNSVSLSVKSIALLMYVGPWGTVCLSCASWRPPSADQTISDLAKLEPCQQRLKPLMSSRMHKCSRSLVVDLSTGMLSMSYGSWSQRKHQENTQTSPPIYLGTPFMKRQQALAKDSHWPGNGHASINGLDASPKERGFLPLSRLI